MSYTAQGLPFAGSTSISRHCSYAGAVDAQDRALPQTLRLLTLLKSRPQGCTDMEAAELLGLERSSINARRRPLVQAGLVYADGTRPGVTGVRNAVWKSR